MSSENPTTTITMDSTERRSVGVVALISMIRMFGLFALLPVLSLYAMELENATPLLVGLAVGAYGLTQAGFQVPLGALSDRIGRIPVIIIGLGIFAAGSILAAISDSIYGIIAGRLLQGAGAISATLSALITDATRKEVRTKSMAIFGIGIGMSFMVAMVAGPLLAAAFGVRSLFWIAAGLTVVAGILLKLLPNIPPAKKKESWNLLPALRADLLRVDFYVFLLHAIMTARDGAGRSLENVRRRFIVVVGHYGSDDHERSSPGAGQADWLGCEHDRRGAAGPDVFRLLGCTSVCSSRHIFWGVQFPGGRSASQAIHAG
jgi:MFS family permease